MPLTAPAVTAPTLDTLNSDTPSSMKSARLPTPVCSLTPRPVPDVFHTVEAVAVLSWISTCGNVVVPVPPEKCAPDTSRPGVESAPAAEKVAAPLWVFAPFKRGMVAPLVPVFTVAAEPNATELVFVQVSTRPPDEVQSPDALSVLLT